MLYTGPLIKPLLQLARSNPDAIVLYNNNKVLTAGQLFQRIIRVASALLTKGFKEYDVAVIAAQPGEEFLEIMYAIVMLHGKIAIIDPEMGRENYMAKMKQLNAQWMFVDSRILFLQEHPVLKWVLQKCYKNFPGIQLIKGMRLVSVGKTLPVFSRHLSFSKLQNYQGELQTFEGDVGQFENIIVYTSGTLAIPKGVLHSEASLNESIRSLSKLFAQTPGAIVGAYLPHFMLLGIASGLPVKYMNPKLSVNRKIAFINKENIGILFGPPSDYMPMILFCENHELILPACLQHILIGSAPVHTQFLQRLIAILPEHTKITCTYGMTENLLVATIDGREKALYNGEGDNLGKPIAGVSVRFSDEGEILVSSPQLFGRYFHEHSGYEWHYTGDIGKMDEHGNIILLGRKKEMIIRRNMNIYPALYENTIKRIKGVNEAAMVGIYSNKMHDEKVYLALEGDDIDISTVRKQLAQGQYSIDKEALPDHILQMTIPRKGRQHKIDRGGIVEYIKKNGL